MPERKNRTRRSMLWVCALAAMVLLAALPATAAWYATQSAAGGSAIATATFEVSVKTETNPAAAPLKQQDLDALMAEYETVWNTVEVANTLVYDTTVVTVTADKGNTASGYVIVTYQNQDYYSDFIVPGGRVTFTVPGVKVQGSDGEITVSGEDAFDELYRNEFVIKAGWGRPEERPMLEKLQEALDGQTADLIALRKQAYLEALETQLKQAKQAAEEAARKAAEEAANQAGQNTGADTELTDIFAGS